MKKVAKNKKNEPKGNAVYSTIEMKRYLGALTETHNEHLKGIKEGFDILNRKLDSHTEIIGILSENVSELKSDMTIVKEDLSFIKGGLKKKVDYDDFLSLVRRVQKIESKI